MRHLLVGLLIGALLASCASASSGAAQLAADPEAAARAHDLALRTVEASEASARWAFAQFIVAALGMIGVVVSLFWTARAVKHASDAASAAQAQIATAREELTVAQQELSLAQQTHEDFVLATERQLRAYLIAAIGELKICKAGAPVRWRIPLRNNGQTPAKNVRLHTSVIYHRLADAIPDDVDYDRTFEGAIIGAGEERSFSFETPFTLTSAQMKELNAKKACILVRCITHYTDVFSADRTTTFAQHFWGTGERGSHTTECVNDFT